jgi:hypothetical protein
MNNARMESALLAVPKKAPAKPAFKAPVKSAAKVVKGRKDMTWGGRPDPAPEAVVVEGTGLNAPWRLNQKP